MSPLDQFFWYTFNPLLPSDEISQLLNYVRRRCESSFAIFAIAALTGMRLAEIQGLKWDCVSFQAGKITVKRIWDSKACCLKETTKTKTIRVIPMAQDLKEILIPMAQGKIATEFVFKVGERNGNFTFHNAAKCVRMYCRKAGVPEISFHGLRHSFASNFVMAGGSIYDLQRILGHSTVSMTEQYNHLSPDHLNGATEILKYGLKKIESKVIPLHRGEK